MARTIEIISRHIGKVNVCVKGENRRILFDQKAEGIGVAMVDNDEAEVLLKPALKDDFWKEGMIKVKTSEQGEPGESDKKEPAGKKEGPKKVGDLVELIKAANTHEEVDAIVGDDKRPGVVSAAEIRKEELTENAPGENQNSDPAPEEEA